MRSHALFVSSAQEEGAWRAGRGGGEAEGSDGGFLERLLASLASPAELAQAAQPRMPEQSLRVLAQFSHNDLLLASMGMSKEVIWPLPPAPWTWPC